MSTKTLNVSDRVLKRATELATLAGVSVDRMLEEMLDGSVPREFSEADLAPNVRALLGVLKTPRATETRHDDPRYEAILEKHG